MLTVYHLAGWGDPPSSSPSAKIRVKVRPFPGRLKLTSLASKLISSIGLLAIGPALLLTGLTSNLFSTQIKVGPAQLCGKALMCQWHPLADYSHPI